MSDSEELFKDPFVPDTVRVRLPDGTDAVDIGATAANHMEAPLPQIDSTSMREGDVLTVEFEDNHQETFEIGSLRIGSLVFGSDEVRRPEVMLKRRTENDNEPREISLHGSAISASGGFHTPGTIRVGSFMMTDLGVSTDVIRSFDLKRSDENGDFQPVMLNRKEHEESSESFTKAKTKFAEMSALLKADGFTFDDVEEDEVLEDGFVIQGGLKKRYKKVNGDLLIYAARQGFGSAIVPQDEIWVYDAETEVLRAMRNIPTKGIFQMAVAEGVTKDIFQKAGNGYRDGSIPDWREPFLDGTHLHWLSHDVPVTSYTWLSPSQEAPIMTVLEDGKKVGNLLQTPKQTGAAFVENMKAHDGEDLIDSVSQALDIDPHDESYIYDRLEVDIYPGEQPKVRQGDAFEWNSKELAEAAARNLQEATTLSPTENGATLKIDRHEIHIRTDIDQEIESMSKAARLTMGSSPKAVGSRILGQWRRLQR